MLAATLDPDGRRVVLTEERWDHIKQRHRYLARRLRDVMGAVREPEQRADGPVSGEEWYFVTDEKPGTWLQVVVHYEGGEGWIATAFNRKKLPRR